MNKKGIFFTILVIAILSLFLISYTMYSFIQDRSSINKRIKTMNNFVFSLEQDMSRQIYISGYRALLSLQTHITEQGQFLDSSEESIKEVLLNGTIETQNISLMEGYKLEDWSSRISEFGEQTNLLINYSLKDVRVFQEDPWNVKIEMSINIFIQDKSGLASWNRTQNISSKISILDFEDPLYLISTNGKVVNKINKTVYEPFVTGTDVSNLILHVGNSSYIDSIDAPSYLDRLEGKISANPEGNGIESLVYLPKLSGQGIAIKDKSVVDYIYFSANNPSAHNIQGMPSWFKIDDAHLDIYQVSGLVS